MVHALHTIAYLFIVFMLVSPLPVRPHSKGGKSFLKRKNKRGDVSCGFCRNTPYVPPLVELTCMYIEQYGLF